MSSPVNLPGIYIRHDLFIYYLLWNSNCMQSFFNQLKIYIHILLELQILNMTFKSLNKPILKYEFFLCVQQIII